MPRVGWEKAIESVPFVGTLAANRPAASFSVGAPSTENNQPGSAWPATGTVAPAANPAFGSATRPVGAWAPTLMTMVVGREARGGEVSAANVATCVPAASAPEGNVWPGLVVRVVRPSTVSEYELASGAVGQATVTLGRRA